MTQAFYVRYAGSGSVGYSTAHCFYVDVQLDASRVNATYGKSETIQPESYKVMYIIKY